MKFVPLIFSKFSNRCSVSNLIFKKLYASSKLRFNLLTILRNAREVSIG